jgi:hypothetical protein
MAFFVVIWAQSEQRDISKILRQVLPSANLSFDQQTFIMLLKIQVINRVSGLIWA